jgi:hypothetical protein
VCSSDLRAVQSTIFYSLSISEASKRILYLKLIPICGCTPNNICVGLVLNASSLAAKENAPGKQKVTTKSGKGTFDLILFAYTASEIPNAAATILSKQSR